LDEMVGRKNKDDNQFLFFLRRQKLA